MEKSYCWIIRLLQNCHTELTQIPIWVSQTNWMPPTIGRTIETKTRTYCKHQTLNSHSNNKSSWVNKRFQFIHYLSKYSIVLYIGMSFSLSLLSFTFCLYVRGCVGVLECVYLHISGWLNDSSLLNHHLHYGRVQIEHLEQVWLSAGIRVLTLSNAIGVRSSSVLRPSKPHLFRCRAHIY